MTSTLRAPAASLASLAVACSTITFTAVAQPAPEAHVGASLATQGTSSAAPDANRPTEAGYGAVRTPKLIRRVGGELESSIEVVDGVYRFKQAMVESPLPDGYPEPTPPGSIDIKEYPSVRRAELTMKDDSGAGMTAGFFPLFNHIKTREIAMTAPVEMDYPGLYADFMKDEPAKEGEAAAGNTTMSFLYRSVTLGPTGEDGRIVVRDTAPVTVLSIGAKGVFDPAREFDALRTWLKSQDEWEVAGDPRMFVYNGPFIDPNWRWSEVQVPIRRRGAATEHAPTTTTTPASGVDASAPTGPRG